MTLTAKTDSFTNINRLVFVEKPEFLLCPLRAEFLRIIYMNISTQGRTMALAVSRRPLMSKVRILSHISPCEICGGHSGTGKGFSLSTSIFPWQFKFTNILYSSSSTNDSYIKEEQANPGNFPKKAILIRKSGRFVLGDSFAFSVCKGLNHGFPTRGPRGRTCKLCIYYKN